MPELTEITPNVFQFGRAANQFLLKTAEGELTLIDAGMPGSTKATLNAVAALGHEPTALKHILVSHADVDHIGSLAGIKAATGATVYAGAESKTHIENRTAPPHIPPPMSWMMGPVTRLLLKPTTVDQVFADGDMLDAVGGIQAIHAPGHTPDNFVFYWPLAGVLFAPDLLFHMGNSLSLSPALFSWDRATTVASAKKVLALDPAVVCVGHGAPVRTPSPDVDALR